ncbi:MAG: hypothetical protein SGILL_008614, partial [Bacillariaceae sp.]
MRILHILLAVLLCHAAFTSAFLPSKHVHTARTASYLPQFQSSTTRVKVAGQEEQNQTSKRKYQKKKRNKITIGDLKKELLSNTGAQGGAANKSKKGRRTRRRVENPQQKYLYAAQRIKVEKRSHEDFDDSHKDDEESSSTNLSNRHMEAARSMGLTNPASQHCDPLVDTVEPEIVGKIRVGEEDNGSGTYAY